VRGRRLRLATLVSLPVLLIAAAGGYAAWKLTRTPAAELRLDLAPGQAVAPGTAPAIPVPPQGAFDLVSTDGGRLASLAPTVPVPIASIAKVATGLVVLQRMPLAGDQPGPTYTITLQDVALYHQVVAEDGSNLPVVAGERFSERQMLLGLLLPSADNLADTLGVWVAGSEAAFVAELNAEAQALGMSQSHFADASGLSPATVSTAADLVLLGRAALANPVLAGLVATPTAQMPDGAVVRNLDADLGTVPGWLGLKTGSSGAAGGCLLFAAQHPAPVGSPQAEVQVVGAILGQPLRGGHGLGPALSGAAAAVTAAWARYTTVDPASLAAPVIPGRVAAPWGSAAGLRASLASAAAPVVARVGAVMDLSAVPVSPLPAAAAVTAGTVLGRVTGRLSGVVVATWTVSATGALGEPPWEWLLGH
jgi:D-alanyl-D-alanine carboxypeptidase (penicillin-binding protein 5/6)